MKKISVVIPVFNQAHLTERSLHSLFANSSLLEEVVVVNNASSDDTVIVLSKIAQEALILKIRFQIIHNETNQGFGRACNQGLRALTLNHESRVVILNNDTWLMKGWDQALIQAQDFHSLDLIGPYFDEGLFDEGRLIQKSLIFTAKNKNKIRTHFMPILMCFKKDTIEKLKFDHGGIFDERFFVTYEDTDLKQRMLSQNLKFGQTGSCLIWHHSMGTRNAKDKEGKALLPSGYEQEGLRLFMEKWGIDPRPSDHTFFVKWKRRYWKWKEKLGWF